MLFTSKIYLGESGYWQGMIGADSWFPLPGERARVRGCEYETLAILYRENHWQSAQVKEREASASLSCYLPLVTAFNRFWFRPWPASSARHPSLRLWLR